ERTSPHFPAAVLIASRLTDAWPKPASGGNGGQFPVVWAPIDQPEVLLAHAPRAPDEPLDKAIARLDALVRRVALEEPSTRDARPPPARFGAMLGATPIPGAVAKQNLYLLAVVLARGEQLGASGPALADAIMSVSAADLRACYEAHFAPAVR